MPVFLSLDENHEKWGIVELQGDLESRTGGPMQSQFIGDLHFGMQDGTPTLIIGGEHILHGEAISLEKPFAIIKRTKRKDETEFVVKALVEKKLVFKSGAIPIITPSPEN